MDLVCLVLYPCVFVSNGCIVLTGKVTKNSASVQFHRLAGLYHTAILIKSDPFLPILLPFVKFLSPGEWQ